MASTDQIPVLAPLRAKDIAEPILFGRTDSGPVRSNNEDHFLIAELWNLMTVFDSSLPPDAIGTEADRFATLLAVADGMGGHANGEEASRTALETLAAACMPLREDDLKGDGVDRFLAGLVTECERRVREVTATDAERPPGTTLTATLVLWPHAHIVHVGDSRLYQIRRGIATRITRDHTIADALHESEADDSPFRHLLTNGIGGGDAPARAETQTVELQDGDVLVCTTDGVSNVLSDTEIGYIASTCEARDACNQMIDLARERGTTDNMTVVVADFGRIEAEGIVSWH